MELWWSGKLPEPPWTHLRSSWIISEIFKILNKIVILDTIFDIFPQVSEGDLKSMIKVIIYS